MTQATLERLWKARATALAKRLNFAWWLERFNSLALGGLLAFALLLLTTRTWRPEWTSPVVVSMALGGTMFVCALGAWLWARSQFVDREVGLVRLEDRLSLHNRLSAAAQAVGPWPELPPTSRMEISGWHWNPARAWLPSLIAFVLVAVAWLIPIPKTSSDSPQVAAPGAWGQMEEWLETLSEEAILEDSAIEELASRVEELRSRPEEEWFSHASLEATDTLQHSLGMELRDLAAEMDTLERTLETLQSFSNQMSEAAKEKHTNDFEKALEALEGSGLSINEDLLKQLRDIDPSQLGKETMDKLSSDQLQALQDQLRKNVGALGAMEGLPQLSEEMLSGTTPSSGFGNDPGGSLGAGGVGQGGGETPIFFRDKETQLESSKLEQVTNEDFSKAALGEVLGLGETEREIDETPAGPIAGGAVSSVGRGGDAVSRENLLPEEEAVLKRYFK